MARPESPPNNGGEIFRRPSATVTLAESPCGNNGEILPHLSPSSGSPKFPYSRQATTTSKNEFQSMFNGTVIHGGTFNFYSREQSSPETKKRKCVESNA